MKLKNKIAVITGGSRGMGRATALLFAQEGAKICIVYKDNNASANAVIDEIKRNNGQAIAIQADISKPGDVKRIFKDTIRTFGTVDILINYAGIIKPKPFMNLTIKDWRETLKINLLGTFLCCQEVAKIMLSKKTGKIVNISSIRGLLNCGRSGIIDYSVSKAAVISFTKTLAKELAPFVSVNCIAPGFTETEMAKKWDDKTRISAINDTYLKRLVQPKEIAQTALFLTSDAANAITGEVIVVDAGYQLK